MARPIVDQNNKLLTATVTDGPSLRAVVGKSDQVFIGYGINCSDVKGRPVPLRFGGAKEEFQLWVLFTLGLNSSETDLMIIKSRFEFQFEDTTSILSLDFDRNQSNNYPKSHLHVYGNNDVVDRMLKTVGRPRDQLVNLHFPIGGLLEHSNLAAVIEWMVRERIVKAREGWEQAIDDYLKFYYQQQRRVVMETQL